jgi:hypothetical protein
MCSEKGSQLCSKFRILPKSSKLDNGLMLVLEVKGIDSQQNKTKRKYLDEWIRAINADGRFGKWAWDVSFRTSDIKDIINKHAIVLEETNSVLKNVS